MRIAVIGTGYVGLVSAACFARAGRYVSCVDIDAAKICLFQHGEIPIYEPGLAAILSSRNVRKRLVFTSDAVGAVSTSEVVFIAVCTPSRPRHHAPNPRQTLVAKNPKKPVGPRPDMFLLRFPEGCAIISRRRRKK
jgi:UDP-glucose 6-dehydrogenase